MSWRGSGARGRGRGGGGGGGGGSGRGGGGGGGGGSWRGGSGGGSNQLAPELVSGVLLFCDQGREQKTLKEAQEVFTAAVRGGDEDAIQDQLNEIRVLEEQLGLDADGALLLGDEADASPPAAAAAFTEIADELDAEIAALKKPRKLSQPACIKGYELGCRGIVFAAFTGEAAPQRLLAGKRASRLRELRQQLARLETEQIGDATELAGLGNATSSLGAAGHSSFFSLHNFAELEHQESGECEGKGEPHQTTDSPTSLERRSRAVTQTVYSVLDTGIMRQQLPVTSAIRIMPIHITSGAKAARIITTVRPVVLSALRSFQKHLAGARATTWCLQFRTRNNTGVKKKEITLAFANMVAEELPEVLVDWKNPDVIVSCEICKHTALMSVFTGREWAHYAKFNVRQLCGLVANPSAATPGDGDDEPDDRVSVQDAVGLGTEAGEGNAQPSDPKRQKTEHKV